jgi:hypothetical protein
MRVRTVRIRKKLTHKRDDMHGMTSFDEKIMVTFLAGKMTLYGGGGDNYLTACSKLVDN